MMISKKASSRGADISVLIVNYRSKKYIKRCIESVFAELSDHLKEIIIINNDEKEDLEDIGIIDSRIRIIDSGSNLGFGRAVNRGAKKAEGEYFLLLNPDTELIEVNFEKVIHEIEADEKIDVVGLKIVNNENQEQKWTVGRREAGLSDLILNNLGLVRKKNRHKNIYWVSGGALLVKKKAFVGVDGFDENFFLYYEDIDFCRRIRANKGKVIQSSGIVVYHLEGGSQTDGKKQKKYYFESQDYYFKKYYGRAALMSVRILRKIFT